MGLYLRRRDQLRPLLLVLGRRNVHAQLCRQVQQVLLFHALQLCRVQVAGQHGGRSAALAVFTLSRRVLATLGGVSTVAVVLPLPGAAAVLEAPRGEQGADLFLHAGGAHKLPGGVLDGHAHGPDGLRRLVVHPGAPGGLPDGGAGRVLHVRARPRRAVGFQPGRHHFGILGGDGLPAFIGPAHVLDRALGNQFFHAPALRSAQQLDQHTGGGGDGVRRRIAGGGVPVRRGGDGLRRRVIVDGGPLLDLLGVGLGHGEHAHNMDGSLFSGADRRGGYPDPGAQAHHRAVFHVLGGEIVQGFASLVIGRFHVLFLLTAPWAHRCYAGSPGNPSIMCPKSNAAKIIT